MFKALGVLLALYTIYAISRDEVYAKSGVWGRTISRTDWPKYFTAVTMVYCLLSVVLLTIF